MELVKKPAIETHGAQLDGKSQTVLLTVLVDHLAIASAQRPIANHFFVGKSLWQH